MQTKFFLFVLLIFFGYFSRANNLQIGAVTHTESGSNHYLNFTISWNNSWRTSSAPFNWDAVWVFVKRRDCAGLQWHHANLSSLDSAHSGGDTLLVDAYADKKGVMIYREADGAGTSSGSIQLKLDSVPAGNYDYQVFGIEMVYVPEGAFYVGDGIPNGFFTASNNAPYLITSESPLNFASSGNNLWGNVGNGGTLAITYPKGYNSFFCMKYEISQGQYADFLNNITQDAAANRVDLTRFGLSRYTMSGAWPSLFAASPNRACNWFCFKDLADYLDWSALSPMTEFEFEKACRGSSDNSAVAGEFAWGGNQVTDADSITAGTDGTPNESFDGTIDIGTGVANFGNDFILGPIRCGFAAKNNTNRFQSGASYYGIMELSGNVYELCYNIYFNTNAQGIFFAGTHGDGVLSTTPAPGFALQGWPVESGPPQDAIDFSSVIAKGGAWVNQDSAKLRVSDRTYFFYYSGASTIDANTRASSFGGRGVSRRQQ